MCTRSLKDVEGEEVLFVLMLTDSTDLCVSFVEDVIMAMFFLAEM